MTKAVCGWTESCKAYRSYRSITEIRQANNSIGHHWFSPETLRFFSSRVHEEIYGGRYFVSSEKGPSGHRRYTVRIALPDGRIDTVGKFQQYASRSGAHKAAARLAGVS